MLIEKIGKVAMLEQTAEECTELAQACLKLARKYRGENPTPKTEKELIDNFYEECADVFICIMELFDSNVMDEDAVEKWAQYKTKRIKERFGIKDNLE